jgi:putative aldouronate transport system substrate-binding protein
MKRTISILLALVLAISVFTACGADKKAETFEQTATAENDKQETTKEETANAEVVDGKFVEKRSITVEIFDRNNNGGSKPEDNFYTDYIKQKMLEKHNVEVTFVPVGRWTEDKDIPNLLAAGTAPDVCVTYNYPAILTYANMGGIVELSEPIDKYKDYIQNLWNWLKEENIYWDQDPTTKKLWALEARLNNQARINTFVREDWLNKLGLSAPTTLQEFEDMLVAFKNNADKLLGKDASKMIPFLTTFDLGWDLNPICVSFVPDSITDEERYVYGFDDRQLLLPGYKEGMRVVNKWYNDGLVWKDFPLYGAGDQTGTNLEKAGYVGSFCGNWDVPYRDGDQGITGQLHTLIGPEANYMAVEPFKNDAGVPRKYINNSIDRKIFFPATNDEVLASFMYLDFISEPETIKFLQIGEEGVTHQVMDDGAIMSIAATGDKIMNSLYNIDYTITINGLNLGDDDLTTRSIALGYAGVDSKYVSSALKTALNEGRAMKNFACGEIKAEEGMSTTLKDKRDNFLAQAITASTADFDKVYDAGMADYLASGGQKIIDERREALKKFYGVDVK